MPSYRITISIGALKPGVEPHTVVPVAAAAAGRLTTVEASDLSVVAGSPRVIVRFTADDGVSALRIGSHVLLATTDVAVTLTSSVTERVKGRWLPVR